MSKKKLLVVCGPTAAGKTSLALHLAKVLVSDPKDFGPVGELVSADSRQVYQGVDIGTGKDVPQGFEFRYSNLGFKDFEVGYYSNGKIRMWGYDLVEATGEFSVGQYVKIVNKIIKNIWKRNKLPILVGGTGLYIKGVIDGISTAVIPKDEVLRKSLEKKSVDELFKLLTGVAPVKAASLNLSDKKNPRRLIRAIEVASFSAKVKNASTIRTVDAKDSVLFIGLTASKAYLHKKIEKRVEERIKSGIEKEIKNLLSAGVGWDNQVMNALGYKQWKGYFTSNKTKEEVIGDWKLAERRYAKMQMTWFKKDKRITWFDIGKKDWQMDVEKVIRNWYYKEGSKN